MANTISNRDARLLREIERARYTEGFAEDERGANTISDRDAQRLRKRLAEAVPETLGTRQSANVISNRDVKQLERMLKRNDGGIARKTRNF